jgi:hypothetical protein
MDTEEYRAAQRAAAALRCAGVNAWPSSQHPGNVQVFPPQVTELADYLIIAVFHVDPPFELRAARDILCDLADYVRASS